MGPARKQLATTQPAANRRKWSLDTETSHMMLQFIRSDELATTSLTRNQPLGTLVLLVDLLPVPRFLKSHLLVGDLEPLLLPHPTPTPEQAGHDPFRTTFFFVKSFFAADDAPLAAAPLADDVALVLASSSFVEES